MKYALLTAAFFSLALAGSAQADSSPWTIEQFNKLADEASVVIGNDQGGFCSGMVIDIKRRLIQTAAHCASEAYSDVEREVVDPVTGEVSTKTIRQKSELEVWHNNYRDFKLLSATHYRVSVVGKGSSDDVAVLQYIDDKYVPPAAVKLATSNNPTRGEHIWLISNPLITFDNSLTEGRVTGENRTMNPEGDHDEEFFQHSALAAPGSSGGALLNDQGELIGTLVRGNQYGIYLGVSVGKLKKLLASVNMKDVYDDSSVKPVSNRLDDK